MELPALLPKELREAVADKTNRDLLDFLVKTPQDFIVFFEHACDDETWSKNHASFMKEAMTWMTDHFLYDQFNVDFAHRAIKKIREHHHILHTFIPKNIQFDVNSNQYEASSLMWGGSSEYLRDRIRKEFVLSLEESAELENLTPEVFEEINSYINSGKVSGLWSKNQNEVLELLEKADEFGLVELMEFCEESLKKFVSRGNVIDFLIQAHEHQWRTLKDYCMEFVNDLNVGVRFEKTPLEYLSMEFLNFREDAMEIFEAIHYNLTHLHCSGDLTEEKTFSEVINRCLNLVCLDISQTNAFTTQLLDIPERLEELDLSMCEWLNTKTLRKIHGICPNLTKISFRSNIQLNYSFWAILGDFTHLSKVDVSHCHQIKEDEFKVLLQACKNVNHLYLKGCKGLSEIAFLEIGKSLLGLTDLDVSNTNISDASLIDCVTHCKHLIYLKVDECPNLTTEGLIEAVRDAPSLKQFEFTLTDFANETLRKIQEARPLLEIIQG